MQVPLKELEQASKILVEMLLIREKYMLLSHQAFPVVTARFLQSLEDQEDFWGVQEIFSKTSLEGWQCKNSLIMDIICHCVNVNRFGLADCIYFNFKNTFTLAIRHNCLLLCNCLWLAYLIVYLLFMSVWVYGQRLAYLVYFYVYKVQPVQHVFCFYHVIFLVSFVLVSC